MTGRNRLTISKTLSFAGTTFFNAILNIWVLEVFGSSKVLGNINGYIGVAAIICNLLGGAFADSRYLVRLLLWSDFIASLVCFYIVGMNLVEELFWLYILVFSLNASTYLASPLFKTLVRYVLAKDEIVKYNTELSFLIQLATIVVPPLATTLYATKWITMNEAILLNGVSYLISFVALFSLRKLKLKNTRLDFNYYAALQELKAKRNILFLVLTGGALNAFLAGFNLYAPLFATTLMKDPALYGYLMSLEAVGGILGIISLKWLDISQKIGLERYLFALAAGALIFVYVFTSIFWIALFTLILTFCLARYNVAIQSIIQQEIVPQVLGKVFSLFFLVVNIGLSSGSFIFGYLFALDHNKPLLLVAGGLILIDLLWFFVTKLEQKEN